MDIKELLDEDAFDPKKLFNEEEYSTLIISREGFSKKENSAADLIESLLDKDRTRQEAEEIFTKLKESNAGEMLVKAIKDARRENEKAILTAACWESGLDMSGHFLFFTELATSANFSLAMEAITVLENCEEPLTQETLKEALGLAENAGNKNKSLTADLVDLIRSRMEH